MLLLHPVCHFSHQQAYDFARATEGMHLSLLPIKGGDLHNLKRHPNAMWRFITPQRNPEEVSAEAAVAAKNAAAAADKMAAGSPTSGNDELKSDDDEDSDDDGPAAKSVSAGRSKLAMSSRLFRKKSSAPTIIRHGHVVCLEQGWFRLEQAPQATLKTSDDVKMGPVAATHLKHVRVGTSEAIHTSERSGWHVHVRDGIRKSKVRCSGRFCEALKSQLR